MGGSQSSQSHSSQLERPEPKEYTVVFLGENGVGKSTTISSIKNYFKYQSFDDAVTHKLSVSIPLKFDVLRKGQPIETIECHVDNEPNTNEDFNSVGQSVTQHPKVYHFKDGDTTYKIIDTPGLSDTRGHEQDQRNKELIKNLIYQQKEIHAICIVLKTNESKLRPEFEWATRELLSLFPKKALKNVFWLFTFSSSSNFAMGDAENVLIAFRDMFRTQHGATFDIDDKWFCVDNEAFKYLLAKDRGVESYDRPERTYRLSWEESARQIRHFLHKLSNIKPIPVSEIIKVNSEVLEGQNLIASVKGMDENVLEENRRNFEERLKKIRDVSMVADINSLRISVNENKTFRSVEEICDNLLNRSDRDY